MHTTFPDYLELCSIPEIIVGLPMFQFCQRVDILTFITRMNIQRLLGPFRGAGQLVIVFWGVIQKVIAQLSSNKALFDKCRGASGMPV